MATELISITFHTSTGAHEMAAFLESLEAQHLVEVKDVAVVVMDVRERPDQAVGDEQRSRDHDCERDDDSPVHVCLLRAGEHKVT